MVFPKIKSPFFSNLENSFAQFPVELVIMPFIKVQTGERLQTNILDGWTEATKQLISLLRG